MADHDATVVAAVKRVRDLAGSPRLGSRDDEAGALTAALLRAGVDGATRSRFWAQLTEATPGQFDWCADIATPWQAAPSPRVSALAETDVQAAGRYIEALTDLASLVAAVRPVDLDRVNAAAFTAASQLRALAPEHGVMPPGSIAAITTRFSQKPTTETPVTALASQADVEPSTDTHPGPDLAELLAELDALVGLDKVKAEVRQQAELLRVARIRGERGLKNPDVTRHLIFTGNPGTGKTTVARLVAKIYASLGLLAKGHLVELDRTGLVGGYLGQTETKTSEAIASALGGVLFIDEAYALAGDQYGDAAVAVLVKAMEDHRDDLVLIAAGYTDRMQEFLDMNPGLASRLRLEIFFPDYTDDQLVEIFSRLATSSDYTPTGGCVSALREVLADAVRDDTFGNARFVRSCFEAALVRQAWRLRDVAEPTVEQLRELTAEDVAAPTPSISSVALG